MANVAVGRFEKGNVPWNKGLVGVQPSTRKGKKCRKHTEEEKRKIGLAVRQEKHWNWKGGKPECLICGKVLSGYNNKRCTKHKGLVGKNSPCWKGGITPFEHAQRAKFRHTIQKEVFKRDNYTCQICGAKGDLQVDHIQEWSKYIELRFSMDNCRTLCTKCHYKITFGREMPKDLKGWGHNLLEREGVAK
jgi:5-methylcytosine-specific restriction endonuclease McrA